MSRSFSIYLDLLRFLAAILVLLYHSNLRIIIEDIVPFSSYGHSAVIVFFVLSGYVIAFVTDTKEKKLIDYSVSRLARIYSVAVPVLILTPLLDYLGSSITPEFYEGRLAFDYWYIRSISSMFFLNEIWFVSIMSYSNVPYWSLCYEIWYYVLFAAYTFFTGKKQLILTSLICLFIGPKILLLFPIWVMGVVLYRSKKLAQFGVIAGMIIWLVSILLIYYFHHLNLQFLIADVFRSYVGEFWYEQFTFSKYFISDYILTILICMNFIGARALLANFSSPNKRFSRIISYTSGFTFILYLIHEPLLRFFAATIDGDPTTIVFYSKVLASVLLSVWLLGQITENRKKQWKQLFYSGFKVVALTITNIKTSKHKNENIRR